ncbi:hypothetical protein BIW11_06039 [Tropilaelaps mercedesae]|uniref:Uncharacterized protein n=1 Tax=Tropilaelaps mercedesae TaxID=418985 RepID=A0A1V9XZU8_9ACAR|nr:hypothetical protein BIW11_06039 [Tropilaelaps mercedesae]
MEATPVTPIRCHQPLKSAPLTPVVPLLPSTPASVQRLIQTAEWAERPQSVDRNVLLTEQIKLKDIRKDDQNNTSPVSQRCLSAPRELGLPSSASVYVDQHIKVISAPSIAPVQVIPSLPVTQRTDEISTISVAVSDATRKKASIAPVAPPTPSPSRFYPSSFRSAEGQCSFRGFTDSKVSKDTSAVVRVKQYERQTTKSEEPGVSAVGYPELQPKSVVSRKQLQLPPVSRSALLPQESIDQALPPKSVTQTEATNIDFFAVHELNQRELDTVVGTRQDNVQLTDSDQRSDYKSKEQKREIQATWTLPRKPCPLDTEATLMTRSFEELSTPIHTDTQPVRTAHSTPIVAESFCRKGESENQAYDDALMEIFMHLKALLNYTSSSGTASGLLCQTITIHIFKNKIFLRILRREKCNIGA